MTTVTVGRTAISLYVCVCKRERRERERRKIKMTFFSNLEVHSSAEIFLKRIMTSLKVKQFKTTFTDHTVEPHTTARSYNTHRDWLVS